MGLDQHDKITHQYCNNIVPSFSELLEMYDSLQIPIFQSSTDEADQQAENITDNIGHDQVLEGVHHDHKMDFHSEQEKQSSSEHNGVVFHTCPDHSDSSKVARRNMKQRMRWTEDLHERFVECVNHLGGAEKATPRAILKLMNSNMLSIFQVKSHLQKYRTSKYIAEYTKGKIEERTILCGTSQLDMKSEKQIKDALQQVNRSLQEQLEIQRNLQLMIEEQGKQLKMMLDQQLKTNENLFLKYSLKMNSDSPMPITNDKIPCNCNSFNNVHFPFDTEDSGSSQFQSDI